MDDSIAEPNVSSLIKTNIILASLSLIGSILIIILYTCYKQLRSFVFSLVLFLAISEVFNSLANMMSINLLIKEGQSNRFDSPVCNLQSIIITYTDICTLTWIIIISHTISHLMVNYNQEVAKRKVIFILLGFGIPLIFTITYVL